MIERIVIDDKEYKFSDLINILEFKELLESFFIATGVPSGIVGNDGEIISQIGWVEACSSFHRVNSKSNQSCLASNLNLMEGLTEGKVNRCLCKNGLLDYATPLVIEGKTIATIFLGQVLEEKPDIKFFEEQALKFNFDKTKYLDAIKDVPIFSKEKMEAHMDCIVKMAKMLAQSSLSKLRQNKLESSLDKTTKERIELEDILNFSPIGIGWSDIGGKIDYINHQFTKLFGYELDDIKDINMWYQKAFPDEKYRNEVILPWSKYVLSCYKKRIPPQELEANVTCKDGTQRRVLISISWIGEKRLVNFSDITKHWKSELRNRAHDDMLEMVAKGASISEILNNIVHTIETEDPSAICSILLLDDEKKHLMTGASSKLPQFYNEAINGVEIGIGVGSCGTAAFLGKRVVVENIMTHKYWKGYTDLALKAGLGSCWSEPIISSTKEVLGTFAIYHKDPVSPHSDDIERISFAANLASIAIENRKVKLELEHRAYYDYLTNLPNRRYFIERGEVELSRFQRYKGELSLMMFDIDFFKKINDKYGHSTGDLVLQKISDISRELLRDVDIIGRIGGEEFAVLLPQTNVDEAVKVAERLRMEIFKAQIVLENEISFNFTASFGVASANNCDNIDKLLNSADLALYDAKNSGRNKVCIYSKESN